MRYHVRMPFTDYRDCLLNLGFRPEGLSALEKFVSFLWNSNKELNLISRKMTFKELMENHLIDCCLPLKNFPSTIKLLADFGSGGGLPGIIYAIQWPSTNVVLFEKSPLKQEFLRKCSQFAQNIEVRGEIKGELKEFDIITSRAFKSLEIILNLSADFYHAGGKYYLLKAREEKILEDIRFSKKEYPDLQTELIKLRSPVLEVERHLLIAGKEVGGARL